MAKETDINFDDDFSEFDDFDFSYDPSAYNVDNSREAIDIISSTALDNVLKSSTAATIGTAIKQHALPKGYVAVIDAVDEAMDMGRTVYDSALKQIRPATASVKTLLRSKESTIDKMLPSWASAKVKEIAVDDSTDNRPYVDPVEAAIQSALLEVFNRSTQMDVTRARLDIANETINSAKVDVQHTQTLYTLSNISTNISRLVGYQDSILENYHRKDLELQMRQYFVLRDLLVVSKASSDNTKNQLAGILKNSSLPDFVKLRLRENYGQLLTNRLLGSTMDKMASYGDVVKKTILEKASNFGGAILGGVKESVVGSVDALNSMSSMIPEGGERDAVLSGVTELLTAAIVKKMSNLGARAAGDLVSDDGSIANNAARFEYLAQEMPKIISRFSRGEIKELPFDIEDLPGGKVISAVSKRLIPKDVYTRGNTKPVLSGRDLVSGKYINVNNNKPIFKFKDITGAVIDSKTGEEVISHEMFINGLFEAKPTGSVEIKEAVNNVIRDALPSFNKERKVAHNLTEIATEQASFDNLTRRSIIEIIPGYLSRILQQITTVATGDNAERLVYSPHTESFVLESENDKEIESRLFNDDRINHRRSGARQIVDSIDSKNLLSEDAKQAFIDKLIKDRDAEEGFDINRYKEKDSFTGVNATVSTELFNFINGKNLNLNEIKNLMISKKFNQLGALDDNVNDAIVNYSSLGDKESLRRLNIIKQVGGKDVVDEDALALRFRGYDVDTENKFFRDMDETYTGESVDDTIIPTIRDTLSGVKRNIGDKFNKGLASVKSKFNRSPNIDVNLDGVRESIAEISKNISESDAFKQASETATKVKSKIKDITNKDKLKEAVDEIVTSEAVAEKIAELRKRGMDAKAITAAIYTSLKADKDATVSKIMDKVNKSESMAIINNSIQTIKDNIPDAEQIDTLVVKANDKKEAAKIALSGLSEKAIVLSRKEQKRAQELVDKYKIVLKDPETYTDLSTTAKETIEKATATLSDVDTYKGIANAIKESEEYKKSKDKVNELANKVKESEEYKKTVATATAFTDSTVTLANENYTKLKDEATKKTEEIKDKLPIADVKATLENVMNSENISSKIADMQAKGKSAKEQATVAYNNIMSMGSGTYANMLRSTNKETILKNIQSIINRSDTSGKGGELTFNSPWTPLKINESVRPTATTTEEDKPTVVETVKEAIETITESFSKKTNNTAGVDTEEVTTKNDECCNGLIDAINENFKTNHVLIQSIIDILANGGSGIPRGRYATGMFNKLKSGGVKFKDFMISYYKGLGSIGGSVLNATGKLVGGAVGGTAGGVVKGFNYMTSVNKDIYIEGEPTPVLPARKVKMGLFKDRNTGKIIKSLDDITGAVVDLEDNIIVSEEDFPKLVDMKGTPIMGLLKGLAGGIGKLWGGQINWMKSVASIPVKLYKSVQKRMNAVRDIYVKGDNKPRLLAIILKSGGYVSAKTGKPIFSAKDIDGEVKDYNGNTVLTMDDLQTGLVDRWGIEIGGSVIGALLKKGGSLAMSAAVGMKNYMKWSFKTTGKGIGLLGKGAKGLTNRLLGNTGSAAVGNTETIEDILHQQLIYQKGLYDKFVGEDVEGYKVTTPDGEEISQTVPKSKPIMGENINTDDKVSDDVTIEDYMSEQLDVLRDISGRDKEGEDKNDSDADDDGLRDNSWQAIAKAKKAKKDAESGKEPKPTKDKDGKENKNSMIMDIIGSIGSMIGGGFTGLVNLIGTALGATGIGTALAGMGTPIMAGLGTAGSSLGALAVTAGAGLGTAATAIGAAVGGTALVGGAILAAGVLAVGGLAYGSYKLFEHFSYSADLEPLEGLRYLQYGVNLKDEEFIYAVRALEDEVFDEISGNPGQYKLDENPNYFYQEFAERFMMRPEVEADGKAWGTWFTKRFIPVLFMHMNVLASLDDSAELDDVDDDLDDFLKVKFVRGVQITERDRANGNNPYAVTASPMLGHPLIQGTALIDEYIARLLATLQADEDLDDFDMDAVMPAEVEKVDTTKEDVANVKYAKVSADSAKELNTSADYSMAGEQNKALLIDNAKTAILGPLGALMALDNLYQHMFNKSTVEPLEGLRFLQYGSSLEDKDFIYNIRALEEEVLDNISWSGKEVTVDEKPNYFFKKFHHAFGRVNDGDVDETAWTTWYIKRFLTILTTHLVALRIIDDSVELDDVDDDLDDDLKLRYILAVQYTEKDLREGNWPYGVLASPMRGHSVINDAGIIDTYIKMLINALQIDEDLDAFDPSALPAAVANNAKITMAIEQKKAEVNEGEVIPIETESSSEKKYGDHIVDPTKKNVVGTDLLSPIANGTISSEFGDRIHPITGAKKPHKGIDFAAPIGTHVVAAADGEIYRQHYSSSYGNVVYLRHDDGRTTRYAHLHAFADGNMVGTRVKRGQLLGYVGNTGTSAGAHLHFEYRKDDRQEAPALDPVEYFAKKENAPVKNSIRESEDVGDDSEFAMGSSKIKVKVPTLDGGTMKNQPTSDVIANEAAKSQNTSVGNKPNPFVVNVDPAMNDKVAGEIIDSQDKIAGSAAQQRAEQIEAQKAMVSKLDLLVATLSRNPTKITTANDIVAEQLPQQKTNTTAKKEWPKTKSTTGVLDLGH